MTGKNIDNIKIYGGEDSAVYFAFKKRGQTITLPQSLDDIIDPAFEDTGWLTEDGAEVQVNVDSGEIKAWQGGTSVLFPVTGSSRATSFTAMEDTPLIAKMFYGASDPALVDPGTARVNLPGAIPPVEGAAIIKATSTDVIKYYVVPLVTVTDRGNVGHTSTDPTTHQMTLGWRGDAYVLTNHPSYIEKALAAGVTPGK